MKKKKYASNKGTNSQAIRKKQQAVRLSIMNAIYNQKYERVRKVKD